MSDSEKKIHTASAQHFLLRSLPPAQSPSDLCSLPFLARAIREIDGSI